MNEQAAVVIALSIGAVQMLAILAVFRYVRRAMSDATRQDLEMPESPLGRHKADPRAHEVMRETMHEKLDRRFDTIEMEIRLLRKEVIEPMTTALTNMAVTTNRAVEENTRTVDLLAMAMKRLGDDTLVPRR